MASNMAGCMSTRPSSVWPSCQRKPKMDICADTDQRQLEKLRRINEILIKRVKHLDDKRGSAHSAFQAAIALEKEVFIRNRELEQALEELYRKNEELAAARAAAEAADRSKTRFLSAASHDLLQPLSAARLFLTALNDTTLDDLQTELIERIGHSFQGVEDLMRAVLDISKLHSHSNTSAQHKMGPVSLKRLLGRLADESAALAATKRLDFRYVETTATVDSDPMYLRRIIQNLLANAIRYTNHGKVLLGVRRRGARVVIEVHDTGIGIHPSQQDLVFEEFHRANPDEATHGVGLGLSIVKRACDMLGHEVTLRSTPGKGTCVNVALRASDGHAATHAQPVFSTSSPAGLVGKGIVVIENDPPLRRAYEILLKHSWQMRAQIVDTTEAALALSGPFDAIIADYSLDGGETGVTSIRRLRAHHRRPLPALLITGHANPDLARDCRREDIKVVAKPVRKRDLERLLMGLIT
ncbi:MAG: hybrid sensor histidine kinase/response regulator [Rhodobacteraceae bacterium]|nr:MAG: hybrid sensor histidine kinase/response regulator [Paracoccaceae bacterium]